MSWYPGHMKKTLDEMREKVKLVDATVEILDARIPWSTKNNLIDNVVKDREHIIILTKRDLADEGETKKWIQYFKSIGLTSCAINCNNKQDIKMTARIFSELKEKILVRKLGKVENMQLKLMIVGMPNVGKSTFLNAHKGKRSAKVGNSPGITRNMQWVKIDNDVLFLDTPGILMTNRQNEDRITKLKILNSIDNSDIDPADLSLEAIDIIRKRYPNMIATRYKIDESGTTLEVLEKIARARGAVLKGNEFDYTRAGSILLDEVRKSIIGRITLESPDEVD